MTIKQLALVFVTAILLTGCETFFAHYKMPENLVTIIGRMNAAVNHCLASEELNKDDGYAFNTVSAQFLDMSVLDRDFYRQRYDEGRAAMERRSSVEIDGKRFSCARLERELPEMTSGLLKVYSSVSSELKQARAAELRQMANNMNSSARSSVGGSANIRTYEWPRVTYVDQPNTTNYLVNTSKGLLQCRVTNKNFVFCM